MKAAILLVLLAGAAAAEPLLIFTKEFKGSNPPYFEVHVTKDGKCVYKEAPDDEQPLDLQLSAGETEVLFQLTEKLDRFQRPLESKIKVAQMGKKTFRYENGETKHSVTFNFTEDTDARLLADWFEKVGSTANIYVVLERAVKFDKLGVNQALLQFETLKDKGRLVSLATFLPLLDRVAKNDSFLNMARTRAMQLAEAIRTVQ